MSDRGIFRAIIAISVFVFAVVLVLQSKIFTLFPDKTSIPAWVFCLPRLNAGLNATCSILLVISLYFVKRKQVEVHKRLNIIAFVLSSLFLVSYIIFHATGIKTVYGGQGLMRSIYYFILITHIILAAVVLPLVLISFQRGLQMQVERHKKLVRIAFPVWLYVTITGAVVYWMISPYYTF